MDRLIYTAASAARSTMERQNTLTQNLANANTTGYRADQVTFRAVPVRGDGASTRVVALEATAGFDAHSGPIQATGRALDVAINGEGYLAVLSANGTEAYTRAGSLDVTPEGVLVTSGGLTVNGEGGQLTIPQGASVSFGADGTVTAHPAGGGPAQTVGRLKLVKPTDETPLTKGADGLLRDRNGEDLPADPTVRLVAGSLEGSNVNVVEAMVNMISAARQFETQMKLLQNAEQNDQRAAQLLAAR